MKNKIVFLIAPPRSLSTAFLRMMEARQDFKIINEPSSAVYNKGHYPYSQFVYSEKAHTDYQAVKERILAMAKEHAIFVKEMSFAFEEFISANTDLLSNPQVHYLFLLRDPHAAMISYYKKLSISSIEFLLPDLVKLSGFSALDRVFHQIKETALNEPLMINADDLYRYPELTVQKFCQHLNLEYDDSYLQWNSLGKDFIAAEAWQESKKDEFVQHWHAEAINSKGFHKPTLYAIDEDLNPTFVEIENSEHRSQCISAYQENKLVYDAILKKHQIL